jgi:hypothetical protein
VEWFKHSTGSHDDPDLSDAWDKFGDAGVVIFWVILEIYGNEFNSLSECGTMDVSIKFLERKLRRRWSAVAPKLVWFQSRGRIYFEVTGDRVKIKIPKFLNLASNWTKRVKSPTEAPTEVTQEQPTAKNRIEEEEKKKGREEDIHIPDWISTDAWNGFVEHRKKIKAPLTDRAISLTINKLEGFKKSGQDPSAILNQSVEMGWKGIFPIGGDNGRSGTGGATKTFEKAGRAKSDGAEYPIDHEF